MKYKVVILDIDGTIVPHKKTISQPTLDAIHQLKERNLKVVIATGRLHTFQLRLFKKRVSTP